MNTPDHFRLSIALAQSGFCVGGVAANVARIRAYYRLAVLAKADLIVFPELTIPGYPPEDLLLSEAFQRRCREALDECAALTDGGGPAILLGNIRREDQSLYNAMFLLEEGQVAAWRDKCRLPNYGIFDEPRYFTQGAIPSPLVWRDISLGVLICEEMWADDLALELKRQGAELLVSANASPFETGKQAARELTAMRRTRETGLPLVYLNQIGGHDEWIFDGASFAMNAVGETCIRLSAFREDFSLLNLDKREGKWHIKSGSIVERREDVEQAYRAIVLGLRDFVGSNGYAGVLLGLSGGIDSALAAAIAVDAIGSEKVRALMLPSPITSQESIDSARDCARRLGIRFDSVSIGAGMEAFSTMMQEMLHGPASDIAVGNNQTRLRAGLLMELSRMERLLLLNTGNKSEMAVGYTTLYGDMCGHYAVLKDVYKTMVYRLAHWRNTQGEVISSHILSRQPTAELLPGQADQDTLPPYDVLDEILYQLVECRSGIDEVAALGFDRDVVAYVAAMLHVSEHKRRQSAPGPKISTMSFWRDRRYPICNGWDIEQLRGFDDASLDRAMKLK